MSAQPLKGIRVLDLSRVLAGPWCSQQLANQAMNYLCSGQVPSRLGNAHPNIVPYQAFATRDGHLILAVGNDAQFGRFCEVAGCSEGKAVLRQFLSSFKANSGSI
jgi:crotonobetainyl-CoA:carnitine CoA-transferase CaiB-like acyl-CoA transferase